MHRMKCVCACACKRLTTWMDSMQVWIESRDRRHSNKNNNNSDFTRRRWWLIWTEALGAAQCSPNQTRIKRDSFLFLWEMIEWILIFSIRALLFESNKSEHHGYSCVIYVLQISPCMALDARSAHTFLNRVSPPPCLLTLNVVLATAAVTTLTAPNHFADWFYFSRSSVVYLCCRLELETDVDVNRRIYYFVSYFIVSACSTVYQITDIHS